MDLGYVALLAELVLAVAGYGDFQWAMVFLEQVEAFP